MEMTEQQKQLQQDYLKAREYLSSTGTLRKLRLRLRELGVGYHFRLEKMKGAGEVWWAVDAYPGPRVSNLVVHLPPDDPFSIVDRLRSIMPKPPEPWTLVDLVKAAALVNLDDDWYDVEPSQPSPSPR